MTSPVTPVTPALLGARERMLGRLRAAAPKNDDRGQHEAALDQRIDAHFDTRRAAPGNPTATLAGRVESLRANFTAVRADVWCARADQWPAQLAARLSAAGTRCVLFNQGSAEGAALAGALPSTIEAISYDRPIDAWKHELFDTVDAGFTVARSGLAATGTLILAPDADNPRTVSLVPPLHVALVYADTLHADLHAAVRNERWADGMPTNLVLVSGPSKTSDIQQTLAYGAHGPREMWVIVVVPDDFDALAPDAGTAAAHANATPVNGATS